MNNQTKYFLRVCDKHKIKVVAIGVKTTRIQASIDFPFDHDLSVFANGSEGCWPSIWRVCEETGVGYGCGNNMQHQLKPNHGLEFGVYYKKNGEWKRQKDGVQ